MIEKLPEFNHRIKNVFIIIFFLALLSNAAKVAEITVNIMRKNPMNGKTLQTPPAAIHANLMNIIQCLDKRTNI